MAPRILQFVRGANERLLVHFRQPWPVSIEKEPGNMLHIDRLEALGLPVAYPIQQARWRVESNDVPIGDGSYLPPRVRRTPITERPH